MSHQPFESWLLIEKSELDFEQKRSLNTHLQTCSSCQNMQHAWASVQHILLTAPQLRPAEGFAQRWQNSLEDRQEAAQRRQVARLLLVLFGAAVIILALVAVQFVTTVSLLDWVISLMREGLRFFAQSQLVYMDLIGWVQRIPKQLMLVGWLMVFGLFSSLAALWMLFLQRIRILGVNQR